MRKRLHVWNRREWLAAAAALASRGTTFAGPAAALSASGLDHVAIAVADVEKSVGFYARLFGPDVLKDRKSARRYFRIGNAYIAIAPPGQSQEAGHVDHFCPGITGFEPAATKTYLDGRGIPSREVAVGMYVTDPDGLQVQLWTENSWARLGRNASPETLSQGSAPLFRPLGLDHILLAVSDPETSASFYEKLLGPVSQRGKDRIWFKVGRGRIGLSPLGSGKRPGVNHFCVAVTGFDPTTAAGRLRDLGAIPQPSESASAPEFLDPDGILLQVTAPPDTARSPRKA